MKAATVKAGAKSAKQAPAVKATAVKTAKTAAVQEAGTSGPLAVIPSPVVEVAEATAYTFTVKGKKADVSFTITSATAQARLGSFLTANITNRLVKLFGMKYARNFAKGEPISVVFGVNGHIMNTAEIAATIGVSLTGGAAQLARNTEGIIPLQAKVSEIVEAGLMLMDGTDYSLPA